MIDFPCQLKGLGWIHPWDALAEQGDHLLIGVAITVVDDDAGVKSIGCSSGGSLCRKGVATGVGESAMECDSNRVFLSD